MNIRDFMDLQKMQKVQDEFSNATGLAAIAIDNDGQREVILQTFV